MLNIDDRCIRFSCLRLRQWPVTYLITLSDWIMSCQPGRHAVVTVCEPDWKHKWAAYIPGLHWVKCFICNAVLATKCTNTWSLIIAYIILHVISMIFQIREYLFMPTYFITFLAWQFMLTSVWYTPLSKLTQADPHIPFVCPQHGVSWYQDKTVFSDLRPTCTLTHWGLVTVWQ